MLQALFSFVVAALSVQQVVAHPLDKRIFDDTDVLNYALTLEHIENAFYSGALAQFDDCAFQDAGLPDWARPRFVEIGTHEQAHVSLLSGALGSKATQPCTYSFPYTDVKSFAVLSQVLEGVGSSAYSGAAQNITTPAYLTVAASILSTEARHAAWIASAVNQAAPWSTAYETPLAPTLVVSLAVAFITSCPSSNPPLGVTPLPTLTIENAVAGQNATVQQASGWQNPAFIAFFSGFDVTFVPVDNGNVLVPANLFGTVYAVATSSGTVAVDGTYLAGPAILSL